MNKDKWKSLVAILIVTGILLGLLFIATSLAKLTAAGKTMIAILVFGTVIVLYVANRLMNTYFSPVLKKYITFFCWAVFLIASSIIYSFLGLIGEVNSTNHSLNAFLLNRVFYNSPEKIAFTEKYRKFIIEGGLKNADLERFNSLISLDKDWLTEVLFDKRAVLQKKDINPSSEVFGNSTTLKKLRAFSINIFAKLRKEKDLNKRLELYKKLLVFSQISSRTGIYGPNTTLVEALMGYAIEKRVIKNILTFILNEPAFWTEAKKEEMFDFVISLNRTRLTASEAYDGEQRFTSTMLYYLYAKHTYAMFWIDLYFGSAAFQYNKILGIYLEAVRSGKVPTSEKWKEINKEATNPLIALSIPNLARVSESFKKYDLYNNTILYKLSGKPQSDPFVPGKDILKITKNDQTVFYSRGVNMIDEGGQGDDITVK